MFPVYLFNQPRVSGNPDYENTAAKRAIKPEKSKCPRCHIKVFSKGFNLGLSGKLFMIRLLSLLKYVAVFISAAARI